MKVDSDNISKVLALFDSEDIPFIKSLDFLKYIKDNETVNSSCKKLVKKKGDNCDRFRK